MAGATIRIGVIGCGAFADFVVEQYLQVSGSRVTAVGGSRNPERLRRFASRFKIPRILDAEAVATSADVDLVYIATPPFLHYTQALTALHAGKHVLCEKPLALNLQQADRLVKLARDEGRLMVANLIQRYNPLAERVKRLIDSKTLGEILHAFFENYASDEGLSRDHWFWDREKSGGIFVEHGVHFFDLFEYWIGPGRVVSAQRTLRPGASFEEQVQCAVRYGETVMVDFYHGFHQPGRMDRQTLCLLFERGDVTLSGWAPVSIRIHGLVDEKARRFLLELFPDAVAKNIDEYHGDGRQCTGRHRSFEADRLIEWTSGREEKKQERYGEMARALLKDQIAWIRDKNHPRKLTEENGLVSLAMALKAKRLSETT